MNTYPHKFNNYTTKVSKISGLNLFEENWIKTLDTILKINLSESELCKIFISQDKEEKGILLLELEYLKNRSSLVLFNGKEEGYEAIILDDYTNIDFGKRQELKDDDNISLFEEVYIWFNYNFDIEEETEKGMIKTIKDEKIPVNDIYENLFDSFGIITKNKFGKTHSLLEIELS